MGLNNVYNFNNPVKHFLNIDTRDFTSGEYNAQLEDDFNNLCIYDN